MFPALISLRQDYRTGLISLWASHGRYYYADRDVWKWQRPNLFCTNEDLFTQTIVVPYLIPMLQNAGYRLHTRERDWQRNEIVIDNDDAVKSVYYFEKEASKRWKNAIRSVLPTATD